ncbi:nitrate reductase molybdenum cofactor assembly chaperone [Leekyejoonella antrihumi]|uniref:Nitrate reductase molybdenum cofactor assembly chaperone n=1 Tax=Leekyejoonella antrihumi TaxID=1660198 RepID=A0A563E0A8_9MICO|nr:nitrate reductase molybdenum cofactor assembly chaperone [Leekyejoonella antrihumi]TWP35809.1 nitrate reductase molybdenum cofactor assembly chaperone [Leekyejoonella antrihumi]
MKRTVSAGTARTDKLASVLLQYPTASLFAGLDVLDEAAAATPKHSAAAFAQFLAWLRSTSSDQVADHYVQTFDLRRRCALYLTYFRYGDTRNRGMAMLAFKTAYRAAGFVPSSEELPDYLPLVLDFASMEPSGQELLTRHRGDLELLRRALDQRESPYAAVIEAVAVQLPGLGRREVAQVTKAWRDGPPKEDVGLEPFAPPEYMQGGRR